MKKIYFFLICAICSSSLFAQWIGDPDTGGTPVCTAATNEGSKISVSELKGVSMGERFVNLNITNWLKIGFYIWFISKFVADLIA